MNGPANDMTHRWVLGLGLGAEAPTHPGGEALGAASCRPEGRV